MSIDRISGTTLKVGGRLRLDGCGVGGGPSTPLYDSTGRRSDGTYTGPGKVWVPETCPSRETDTMSKERESDFCGGKGVT